MSSLLLLATLVLAPASSDGPDAAAVAARIPAGSALFKSSRLAHRFRHSPDGTRVAFLDAERPEPDPDLPAIEDPQDALDFDRLRARYQLVVADASGGQRTPLGEATYHFDHTHGPVWSPDGKCVALATFESRDGAPVARIDVATVESETTGTPGSVRTLVTEKGSAFFAPAWSHSGDRIAVARYQLVPEPNGTHATELLLYHADGKRERRVELPAAESFVLLAWSPDDATIAVVASADIAVVDVAAGKMSRIGSTPPGEPRRAPIQWLPAGDQFLVAGDGGIARVVVADRSVRMIPLLSDVERIALVPDTRFALVLTTKQKESIPDALSMFAHAGESDRSYAHAALLVDLDSGVVSELAAHQWTDDRKYLWLEDRAALCEAFSRWTQ